MALGEVPAAGADEQRGRVFAQLVAPAVGVAVGDRAVDRVAEVPVSVDHVVPRRRVGVLEVGHEPVRTRVQRVDDHLAVGRAGDLDPALLERRRGGRDRPIGLADLERVGQEVEHLPRPQPGPAARAGLEQLAAAGAEPLLELGHELERVGGEDLVEAGRDGAVQLQPGVCGHQVILSLALVDASRSEASRLKTRRTVSDSAAHRAPSRAATAAATAQAAIAPEIA